MSVRNLDAIFRPRSVALIGATDRPGSAGLVTMENLLRCGISGLNLSGEPEAQDRGWNARLPGRSKFAVRRRISL